MVMFPERGKWAGWLINSKLTLRPRKYYINHQIEQEAHHPFWFLREWLCDCCKLKSQAHKEFDEGIAKSNCWAELQRKVTNTQGRLFHPNLFLKQPNHLLRTPELVHCTTRTEIYASQHIYGTLHSVKHFSYPLIKFFVCLTFQFEAIRKSFFQKSEWMVSLLLNLMVYIIFPRS